MKTTPSDPVMPDDTQKALSSLDLLRLRAYSHAKISNSPKDMQDWIDSDVEKIRAVICKPSLIETKELENAIDWVMNSTFSNAYGDKRDGAKMLDVIINAARCNTTALTAAIQKDAADLEQLIRELAICIKADIHPAWVVKRAAAEALAIVRGWKGDKS